MDDMVLGTSRSRLAAAMSSATEDPAEQEYTFQESNDLLGRYRQSSGIDNPYGQGVSAYEPHTVIFDGYANAYAKVQDSKDKEAYDKAIKDAHSATYDFRSTTAPGDFPPMEASGKVGAAINAAMDLANRHVPYVWGGTSRNGVDCSGLIYYAFNAAGIQVPRYRAVDWGHMGTAVTAQDARPGDIVYFDEPGDTDHVGIYVGNGKMIQAPQTGDVVRVSNVGHATSYRRVFEDNQFAQVMTPEGGAYWQYGRTPAQAAKWGSAPASDPRPRNTITRTTTQFQRAL